MIAPAAFDSPVSVVVTPPAPALRPYVTFYYDVVARAPITDFLYPEWGNVRVALAGEWHVAVDGGYDRVPQPAALFGPTDRRGEVTAAVGRMAGFGLTPIGWHRLFGDAAAMANRVRPLGDALDIDPETLRGELIARADPLAAAALWETLLTALIARRPAEEARACALDAALRAGPADVASFARSVGLSERSLHRACFQLFGFAPKRLLRRERFLDTLGRIRSAVRAPVMPSLGGGYYDLPQFYRDFRTFMGMTPRAYFAHPRVLMGAAAVAQVAAGVTLSFAHDGPAVAEIAKTSTRPAA